MMWVKWSVECDVCDVVCGVLSCVVGGVVCECGGVDDVSDGDCVWWRCDVNGDGGVDGDVCVCDDGVDDFV